MSRHETEIWWNVGSIVALLVVVIVGKRSSKPPPLLLIALFFVTLGSIVLSARLVEGTGYSSLVPGIPVAAVLAVVWMVDVARAKQRRRDAPAPTQHDTS